MPYAGDVAPAAAYALLVADPAAVLVDVRTRAEWSYVGGPDLNGLGKPVLQIEWVRFPDGARNEGFVAQLEATGVPKDAPVLFLCRSGVRSVAAAEAATAAGWTAAQNVLEGFEGNPDGAGHRGTTGGWKVAGLPWRQS
ncbi:MAG TPA: rhodanese-like domain-containing protein [Kineosporiaceae bacterium]